ncbi:DUF1553 domain-containing protein [Polystyrenella longa]|uniref:DUF1553 domain-containing protein n=1 Tax=Polystyrenella longa TaxID=2528007 RepID=UPI0011A0DE4A|nr:DUF1553 domain-containing protein [Polystyrenella longa]
MPTFTVNNRAHWLSRNQLTTGLLFGLTVVWGFPGQAEEEVPAAKPATEFSAGQIEHFEKKIRPLLVERCQDCHNTEVSEGGLDLSSRPGILKGGDSGSAFDNNHPPQSLLLDAISYKPDAIVEMPPDGRLDPAEVAAITKWVEEGLPWPGAQPTPEGDDVAEEESDFPFTEEQLQYWSFQVPTKAEPPQVKQTEWPRNEIDHFILAQLEANEMHPAPQADKLTLLRRATFDLTGLPPTPEEIREFVADENEDAFAKVVDRLLASDAYGERWGRHWLDIARYADTNGMDENMAYAYAYLYRNYVISAFNKDKPYDQFIKEQLAGDLIPHPDDEQQTIERQIATGFLAIGPKMLAEDDPVKMHMDIIDEQLDTSGKAFLGMTLGCARCHDHKFDPITAKDYYSLAGIFKSTKTMENYRVVAQWYERPVEPQARIDAYAAYEKDRDAVKKTIDELVNKANTEIQIAARTRAKEYLLAATSVLSSRSHFDQLVDQWNNDKTASVENSIDRLAEKFDRGNVDVQEQTADPRVAVILTFKQGASMAEYDVEIPQEGKYAMFLQYAAHQSRPLKISVNGEVIKETAADQVTGSWGPDGQKWFFEQVIDLKQGKNIVQLACTKLFPHVHQFRLVPESADGTIVPPIASTDQNQSESDLNSLILDQWVSFLKAEEANPKSIFKPWFALGKNQDEADPAYSRLKTSVQKATKHAKNDLAESYAALFLEAEQSWTAMKAEEATKEAMALPDAELEAFRQVYLGEKGPFRVPENVEQGYSEEVKPLLGEHRSKLKAIEDNAPAPLQLALGVTESKIENMQVCIRGNHVNLGPEVPRQFLSIVEGPDQTPLGDEESGRLALAEWLAKPDHPLTSRVMINRIWRWHMGTGLVRTPDNFGLTGETPSHPQLLDWLAVTFIEQGWSMKTMHRLIMNSATYQMSSDYSAEYTELDPENKLYWQMNRHRLEAEAIRDSILAIAGTLDRTQVDTTLDYKSHTYVNSTGGAGAVSYDFNYRSIYLPIIRSALYEMFQAYDFPDPSYMQGNRATTTIAPQALFLMNSEFVDKQTEAMAKRLLQEAPDAPEDRIERAFELIYGRKPEIKEMEEMLGFVYEYEQQVVSSIPEQDLRQLQVWKGLCRVLLSSNEFIFVD